MALSPKKKPTLPGTEESNQQVSLFGDQPSAPAKTAPEEEAAKVIYVHFETWEDYDKFQQDILQGTKLRTDTRSIWYPPEKVAS